MKIGFAIDHWETLKPEKDTTLRLIHEAVRRGHEVGLLYPRNLAVRDNVTMCMVHQFEPEAKISDRVATFHSRARFRKQRMPVKEFDAVLLRINPPLDPLAMNFMDSVKRDTVIINSVDGLRMANNKLYLTTFEDSNDIIPATYVSKDKDYLYDIIMEQPADKMILKPIDGYGGTGVILLEKRAKRNIRSLLDFYIGEKTSRYVILQEYIDSVDSGDVRVWMLNGKVGGAYKRVPSDTDIRANLHSGGSAHPHVLTDHERLVCERVGPKLVADGLYIAGLDLIGEKLIEVNVVSPGGVVNINRFEKKRLECDAIDFVEEKASRGAAAHT